MYINKAIIYGNLTRDPELKALPNGNAVVNFSVATNETWKDKSGAKQERVEYHNVVFYGKVAEVINQYCKKGSGIYVEGSMQTRSWEKDGVKQYKTEIVGSNFQFGSKSGDKASSEKSDTVEYSEDEINPDDIPF